HGLDLDRAVDQPELPRRGLCLGEIVPDVLLVEEDLPLQVVGLDEITVDDSQAAHSGPRQVVGQHGPERTAAAERDLAREQGTLAGLAQGGETDLSRVTLERVVGRRGHVSSPVRSRGRSDQIKIGIDQGSIRSMVLEIRSDQPPATAGMMLTSSFSATGVARSSR